LVVPSVAIGGALLFGGDASPWAHFFAPLFAAQAHLAAAQTPAPAISENFTSVIVVIVVAIGFYHRVAALCYCGGATRCGPALAPRGGNDAGRADESLYFDAAIDAIFVRPAQAWGSFSVASSILAWIDGAVGEIVLIARGLGTLVRSFQTGLLRAYALILVFGQPVHRVLRCSRAAH